MITIKFTRSETCDLLKACTAISDSLKRDGETADKWDSLHDKLTKCLDESDKAAKAKEATK